MQAHTCTGSSFASRLLLYVLPHSAYKGKLKHVWFQVLDLVVQDLAALFHSGINCEGETWYPIIIGVKGDAPALSKLGAFTRSFNHLQGGGGICHHCLAGRDGHMWEDLTRNASWLQTLYQERPWKPEKPSHVLPIPFSDLAPEKIFRSDAMHLIKLGIGRHFLASAIIVLGDFDVFNGSASGVAKLLENAHKDFMYTCKHEIHQTPNLKQFTREGFHWPRRTSYPFGGSMDALMKGFIGQIRHSRCMHVSKTGNTVCIRALDFCKLLAACMVFIWDLFSPRL